MLRLSEPASATKSPGRTLVRHSKTSSDPTSNDGTSSHGTPKNKTPKKMLKKLVPMAISFYFDKNYSNKYLSNYAFVMFQVEYCVTV